MFAKLPIRAACRRPRELPAGTTGAHTLIASGRLRLANKLANLTPSKAASPTHSDPFLGLPLYFGLGQRRNGTAFAAESAPMQFRSISGSATPGVPVVG